MLRQAGQLHLRAFHLHNQRRTYGGVVGGPGIAAADKWFLLVVSGTSDFNASNKDAASSKDGQTIKSSCETAQYTASEAQATGWRAERLGT